MKSKEKLPSLYHSVGVRIETLSERLNNLPLEKSPTESGKILVDLFLKGAKRLFELLKKNSKYWLDGARDRESLKAVVRQIGNSTAILYSFLEYIEAFCFEKTRAEIILPFELLMKEHFPESKDDIFIFYPQWEFNFSYRNLKSELRKRLFLITKEEGDEFFKDIPGRIAIISFPALERDNILAFVVLAHELAHYFDIDPNAPSQQISNSQDVLAHVSIPNEKVRKWIEASKNLDPLPVSVPPLFVDIEHSSRIITKIQRSIPCWLRELTADISAARYFGIGFYLCARELFSLIVSPLDSPYPPNSKRLEQIALEIIGTDDGFEADVMRRIGDDLNEAEKELVEEVMQKMNLDIDSGDKLSVEQLLDQTGSSQLSLDQRKEKLEEATIKIIEESISNALLAVKEKVRQKIPLDVCLHLSKDIFIASHYLKNGIPPAEKLDSQPIEKPLIFDIRMILNAVWLRWLEISKELSITKKSHSEYEHSIKVYYTKLNTLSRIALRAIELSNFHREYKPKDNNLFEKAYEENKKLITKKIKISKAGVLGKKEIVSLMVKKNIKKSIVVMPLLDPRQITEASLDVILGNVFIVMRQTRLPFLDFREIEQKDQATNVYEFQERIQLRPEGYIILHPNQFILGSTLEYISLPNDVMAYVIGKSSLGRTGLVIATATHVAPGYKGIITLELSNLGSVPIILYPTMPIAQLVFHRLCSPVKKGYAEKGGYAYSTGPEFSRYLKKSKII